MKFEIKAIRENPVTLLRRAGYTFQRQENPARDAVHGTAGGGEMSFVRPLAAAGYPRFHMYVRIQGTTLNISFHLDQKKHTYGEETRHHGEYDESGPVKEEAERLKRLLTPTVQPLQYDI
jgi:hypothetical protein